MRALPSLLLILVILSGSAGPGEATPVRCCLLTIDDFTQGAMNPTNGPFEYTHSGLPTESCLGGSRRVWINDLPTNTAGMIPYGGSMIAFRIQTEENNVNNEVMDDADVVLDYEMPEPTDLTAGGVNDRLIIEVISVTDMSVFVVFGFPGGSVATTLFLAPGTNTLFFSKVYTGDLEHITRLSFYFNEQSFTGVSEVTINRIRVTNSIERFALMEIPTLIEIGPPYPLPGPLMGISYPGLDGGIVETAGLELTLLNAYELPVIAAPIPFPVNLNTSDSGEGRDPGISAGFQCFEGAPASTGKAALVDGAFEFAVSLQAWGGNFPHEVSLLTDTVGRYGNVFYIPFAVDVRDATGGPMGTLFQRLRVQVPDDVPYDFDGIWTVPPDPVTPVDFGFGFELRDDGSGAAQAKAEGQPLFDIQLESDWLAYFEPSPVPPPGLRDDLVLAAHPSVLSDRTQLSLSRTLDRATTVRIYDLAGRALRTLELPAGQTATTWDARDDANRRLPTGVYLARVRDGARGATRRLVVVR